MLSAAVRTNAVESLPWPTASAIARATTIESLPAADAASRANTVESQPAASAIAQPAHGAIARQSATGCGPAAKPPVLGSSGHGASAGRDAKSVAGLRRAATAIDGTSRRLDSAALVSGVSTRRRSFDRAGRNARASVQRGSRDFSEHQSRNGAEPEPHDCAELDSCNRAGRKPRGSVGHKPLHAAGWELQLSWKFHATVDVAGCRIGRSPSGLAFVYQRGHRPDGQRQQRLYAKARGRLDCG